VWNRAVTTKSDVLQASKMSTDYPRDSGATGRKGAAMVKDGMRIWKDEEGRLWSLADSGIDTEIFEIIGEPVYDEAAHLWYQQIALRAT
jgi:hypothetical protein